MEHYLQPIDQPIVERFVFALQSADGERGRLRIIVRGGVAAFVVGDDSQFASEQIPDGVHPFDDQTSLGAVHRQSVGVRRRRSVVHRSTSSSCSSSSSTSYFCDTATDRYGPFALSTRRRRRRRRSRRHRRPRRRQVFRQQAKDHDVADDV